MFNHKWTILAQDAVVDERTNSLSILKIIEKLEVGFAPKQSEEYEKAQEGDIIGIPIQAHLVSYLSREPEHISKETAFELQYEVLHPVGKKGKTIPKIKRNVPVSAGIRNMRVLTNLGNFPILKDVEGYYRLIVYHKNEEGRFKKVADFNIEIVFNDGSAKTSKE